MLKKKITNLVMSIFLSLFLIFITFSSVCFDVFLQTNNRNIVSISSTSNSMVLEWEETWSGGNDDYGYGVAIDSFDNIYIVGKTGTLGDWDMVLAKYNSSGVQQWNRTWGGDQDDLGCGLVIDSSDNIYIVGRTSSFGAGNMDIVLVKYNSLGELQWYKTWGESDKDTGYGVAIDSSDNIYVVGTTQAQDDEWSYLFLLKFSIDTDGDEIPSDGLPSDGLPSDGLPSEFTFIITIIVIFSIVAGIGYAVVKVSKKKRVKDEKYYTSIRAEEGQVDLKNILRGMAKTKGEIDLKYLSKQMNKDIEKLRLFVYDLVGSSSLDGKMEGNKFIFSETSDIDSTIDTLLNTYADWEKQDKGKL